MTWPAGRFPVGPPVPPLTAQGRDAATPVPVPLGRSLWRFVIAQRGFVPTDWAVAAEAELANARSRRLEQNWNQSATLTFVVDGRSDAASIITELQTDIIALRWNDGGNYGGDIPMFRGVVTQSEDSLSEQEHTVTFTAKDYFAVLSRRMLTTTLIEAQTPQDNIVSDLLTRAGTGARTSSGTNLSPGSYIPLSAAFCNPDGSFGRAPVQPRDRTYYAGQEIGQAISDLAAVINGFDFDVQAQGQGITAGDYLRLFYPYQGVVRSAPALVYGSTVTAVTRSVNSADYANYMRAIGNNPNSTDPAQQMFAEALSPDANDVTRIPIGLWMSQDNAADVSIQSTLNDKANGDLALNGILTPTYALTLRPGFYTSALFNMGDVLPLVIQAGRLNVNTTVRVLGITFDIGDDGQEDVTLTVGRPATTLPQLLSGPVHDTNALTRR